MSHGDHGLFFVHFTFASFILGANNQQGKFGTLNHTLGDAAHGPALQTAAAMRCHGDYIAAAKGTTPLGIFAIFRHSNDGRCCVCIDCNRPGNSELELGGDTPFRCSVIESRYFSLFVACVLLW